MTGRPQLFTRGLSGLSGLSQSQSADASSPAASSPAEQRDDAKRNFLKTMRALPTQHYWDVYFDRSGNIIFGRETQSKDTAATTTAAAQTDSKDEYKTSLEKLETRIESVQDFWRYNNNTPVDQIKMRESIYLFKSGFRPVWEDRRNITGGCWTLRVPKAVGPDVWTRIQLLAIGEVLEGALDDDDQLCGVGLSVRFNSHLITIWNRDASKKTSIDGIIECVLEQLPEELRPKPDAYYYKKHADHPGFNPPPELRAVLESQKKNGTVAPSPANNPAVSAGEAPEVKVDSPQ
ncbi:Eukaryotic initiation factor 4E [Geosmithia morbida]|uniref:Eukaryotic initiation factor 4E n=1 Tax=Geosmithia morbida TaxID=1094350 RepID=A0A9P5D0N0_9HYPO|nr:Eukaryotic initiation factor 4E [Geosmithia morbida]KAF4119611.1 Eukaryotic initiation factor 4E [Geosmithia morbida]